MTKPNANRNFTNPNTEYATIPPGTILYRATTYPTRLGLRKCTDTGKYGVYLGSSQLLCRGMGFEYGCDMYQSRYITKKPIAVFRGKYGFRDIEPDRFYVCQESGMIRPGVRISPTTNINHFDFEAHPIDDSVQYRGETDGEIFISNEKDLSKLRLIDCRYVRHRFCAKLNKVKLNTCFTIQYLYFTIVFLTILAYFSIHLSTFLFK